jgi:hypothetical protein
MPLPVAILGPSDHSTTTAAIRDGTNVGIVVQ